MDMEFAAFHGDTWKLGVYVGGWPIRGKAILV